MILDSGLPFWATLYNVHCIQLQLAIAFLRVSVQTSYFSFLFRFRCGQM